MPIAQHFHCAVTWAGATAGPTLDQKTFSRDATISIAGQPPIAASAAQAYLGDPTRINPEELFIASLALCQMLSYLFLAARRGVAVVGYASDADGELAWQDGKMRMTQVTLRPTITIVTTADVTLAEELVTLAHDGCFIANSVTCPVYLEPTILQAASD